MNAQLLLGRWAPAAVCLAGALAGPTRAEPPPAFIEFVSPQVARIQAPRPQEGVFVLDLDGLESAQAAQDLVDSWHGRRSGARLPACWLRGRHRDELLIAARQLTQGPAPTCGQVLLGLR